MKILLVDDSQTMRRIQKKSLGNTGFTDVLEAPNAIEALKILNEINIDLVLLDINMPEMDGITMLKKIKSDDKLKKVKVIMVTSESDEDIIIDALKAGANGYIAKPFNPNFLKEKIDDLR